MNMLANISIGKRLALGFTVILAFAMLITGIGVWRLQGVAAATAACARYFIGFMKIMYLINVRPCERNEVKRGNLSFSARVRILT